jgi:hypothetical protein
MEAPEFIEGQFRAKPGTDRVSPDDFWDSLAPEPPRNLKKRSIRMIKWLFKQPWVWPQQQSDSPRFINRLGRVFHWVWAATSAFCLVAAVFNAAFCVWDWLNGDEVDSAFSQGVIGFLIGGLATWMIGRGVRYVFSAE